MQAYERCRPDIVKSVQQRWLHAYWSRQLNGASLPPSDQFALDKIESCRDDLSILDVVPHNGVHRFRILDHGKNVGAMYAGQCAGKFLDEVLPEAARTHTLETYEHAVRSRVPVYTVSQMTDATGRPILYERLLLPLGNAAGQVVRILALLETISIEGTIERRSLMTDPQPGNGYTTMAELHASARRISV
jgi:hypothetical protein